MDFPLAGSQQETCCDRVHDFRWRCSCIPWRTKVQLVRFHRASCCCCCESQYPLFFLILDIKHFPLASQFEASRLVMIQILLHGLKMDPLVSLHFYAPVCAFINLLTLPFTVIGKGRPTSPTTINKWTTSVQDGAEAFKDRKPFQYPVESFLIWTIIC